MTKTLETDVLVIGTGGAGCRAALEASQAGAKVVLVTKGKLGKSGTTAARVADTAGFNVADGIVDPADNPRVHYEDIIKAGLGMTYEQLAKVLTKDSVETIPFLESIGVKFQKDSLTGQYIELIGCFASRPHMHVLKDHGEPIINALVPAIKNLPILIEENTLITRLLIKDGICTGAVGIDKDGMPLLLKAKAVILAAGGAGQLFKYTLAPKDITGDGYALGLLAGADLVNMEYMQVVLGTVTPTKNQVNTFLWCARPKLKDAENNPFLEKYLPEGVSLEECMEAKSTHFPFSSRDNSKYVEIAVQKEIRKGRGTAEGGVYLDLTEIDDEMVSRLPSDSPLPKVWTLVKSFMAARGFNIKDEPIQVACFAHAINGGLKIDESCRTTVRGLYAAGEVAGGPHGADRLGGNMLLTCQVFGKRAGLAAAEKAFKTSVEVIPDELVSAELKRLSSISTRNGKFSPQELKLRLQESMWKGALVVRTEDSLNCTLLELEVIKNDLQDVTVANVKDFKVLLELENLLVVGEAIIKAALFRKESRGSHYREDFPRIDPEWETRVLVSYGLNGIEVRKENIKA